MITVVGTFLWYNDKFLIIQRHPDKPQGGTWGLPAGKVDAGESDAEAAVRELREETGVQLNSVEWMSEIEYAHVGQNKIKFVSFEYRITDPPIVAVNQNESAAFQWVTLEECLSLPTVISGLREQMVACKYI